MKKIVAQVIAVLAVFCYIFAPILYGLGWAAEKSWLEFLFPALIVVAIVLWAVVTIVESK